jgi:membrane-bound serine protease (ClpP class)
MLIDTNIPQFQVSWPVIAGAGAASAVFLILVIGYAWSSQARKIQSGSEQLIGSKAVVLDWEGGEGHVWVEGERWTARGEGDFAEGESVKIVKRDGLTLIVKAESLITSRREASGHREKV